VPGNAVSSVGNLWGNAAAARTCGISVGRADAQLRAAAAHPALRKAWADSAYRTAVTEHAATLGIDVEVVRRDPATRGFAALPRRWTVERTFGWLMLHRRLARDYEALPARSEAMIHLAMIDLMTRRCTGESTPTWRGT
jgi:transposase